MPSITTREYHPESGALLGNISILNFGKITSGTHSRVKVVDISFGDVTSVSNLKIGVISSGGILVNEDPQDIDADGSASNGHMGVESSSSFSSSKASTALSRHFAGINGTGTSSNSNNVSVSMRNSTVSNYIYLDIEVGASLEGLTNGSYKIFFDYS